MKTKAFFLSFLFAAAIGLSNCKQDQECETKIATCNEAVPDDDCLAYFERWIYDKEKNTCELIPYSGCTEVGFETEEECQACKCD